MPRARVTPGHQPGAPAAPRLSRKVGSASISDASECFDGGRRRARLLRRGAEISRTNLQATQVWQSFLLPRPPSLSLPLKCMAPFPVSLDEHPFAWPNQRPISVGQYADELAVGGPLPNQAREMPPCWVLAHSNRDVSGWMIMLCGSERLAAPQAGRANRSCKASFSHHSSVCGPTSDPFPR